MANELIEAIKAGNKKEAMELIAKSEAPAALITEKDEEGNTALHWAVIKGYADITTNILASANTFHSYNNDGNTALHLAAWYGHTDVISVLLDHSNSPFKVNEKNEKTKATPLHEAALAGNTNAVKLLLERGANLNLKTNGEYTALELAMNRDRSEVVKLLGEHNQYLNQQLLDAAKAGNEQQVAGLIARGADINRQLLNTAANGTAEEVESLLNQGADVNYKGTLDSRDKSNYKRTALFLAAQAGNIATMTELLERGANIDATNSNGMTALYTAIANSTEALRLLLARGAQVNINSYQSMTPLHYAVYWGEIEAIEILLQHKAEVNASNMSSCTPLHFAAEFRWLEAAKILLLNGADIHLKRYDGKTALEIAKIAARAHSSKEFEQIAELIEAEQKKVEVVQKKPEVMQQEADTTQKEVKIAQRKAKRAKAFEIAALCVLLLLATGGLVIGIGALAGWGVMVGLLSFAPWLAIAIPAAIVGITVVGTLAYGIKRLIANKQEQLAKLDKLSHSSKERLLDKSPDKQDEVKQALGAASSFGNPLASPSSDAPSPSVGTSSNQPKG